MDDYELYQADRDQDSREKVYRDRYDDAFGRVRFKQLEPPKERNWVEVAAGALIAAAGVYFLLRGLQERSHRHASSLPHLGGSERGKGTEVRESVTVNKPAAELYSYWRKLENLPEIMRHLKSVEDLGGGRSHWVAKGPLNTSVAWDAEITEDVENVRIAWRSLPDSQVPNEGSVAFREAPGARGTEVRVSLTYHPPLGPVGATVAKLFGEAPSQQIGEDLKRYKQRLEAGEIASIKGQSSGPS